MNDAFRKGFEKTAISLKKIKDAANKAFEVGKSGQGARISKGYVERGGNALEMAESNLQAIDKAHAKGK